MHENSGIEAQRAEVRTRSLRIEIGTGVRFLERGATSPSHPSQPARKYEQI